MLMINKVRRLRTEDAQGVLRVRNFHVKQNGGLFERLTPVKVVNNSNKKWVIRNVRGSGPSNYISSEAGLDYDAFVKLGLNLPYREANQPHNLTLTKASFVDQLTWLWTHQELTERLSFRISLLSLALAVLSWFF